MPGLRPSQAGHRVAAWALGPSRPGSIECTNAYATTIHKAQGSEYPVVVIPLMTQHYAMLARNLLYTGVTRGKRLVVLVGQRKALAMAVRNAGGRRRWSKLREWMALVPAPGRGRGRGRQPGDGANGSTMPNMRGA